MKKLVLGLLACWVVGQVSAEEGPWLTDFSKAQAKAKAEKKLVLMDFNGSDWCAPCKELRKEIFDSAEFREFAKDNLVLVDLDFPEHKQQTEELKQANKELSKKFEVEGFPTVIVLGPEGKELKRVEGLPEMNAKQFVAGLKKLKSKG